MIKLYIGAGIFFVGLIISRIVNERAGKALDNEHKLALIDAFSKDRLMNVFVLIGIILAFYLVSMYSTLSPNTSFLLYFTSFALWMISRIVISTMKLKRMQFPAAYISSYIISSLASTIGIIALFLAVYSQFSEFQGIK